MKTPAIATTASDRAMARAKMCRFSMPISWATRGRPRSPEGAAERRAVEEKLQAADDDHGDERTG